MFEGDDLTVTIRPQEGYKTSRLLVDGAETALTAAYTFTNITGDHTIRAEFQRLQYTITAAAGSHGTISPSGIVKVYWGDDRRFDFTPDTGYRVADVFVNGTSLGPRSAYVFEDVKASQTIEVEFEIITFTIEASSSTGGRIRPTGTIVVEYGTDKTFSLESAQPQVYQIDRLMVDGRNKGALLTYTFTNITADHTIRALWKKRQYKIESSCTEGGTIVPLGTRWYEAQAAPTYTVTPEPGYVIERVVIDGSRSVGPVRAYTFDPLLSDHTIRAYFKLKTYTVTVSRRYSDGSSGTPPNPVSPLGTVTVNHGDDLSIRIDNHYQGGGGSVIYSLDYITVNGASHTYRGDTKSIIVHTLANIREDKQVVCYFYQRTN